MRSKETVKQILSVETVYLLAISKTTRCESPVAVAARVVFVNKACQDSMLRIYLKKRHPPSYA